MKCAIQFILIFIIVVTVTIIFKNAQLSDKIIFDNNLDTLVYKEVNRYNDINIISSINKDSLYSTKLVDAVLYWSNYYKLDKYLIYSIIYTESHFKPNQVGLAGEIGNMQVMPNTIRMYEKSHGICHIDMQDPWNNVAVGTWYISKKIKEHKNINKALAYYNAGKYWDTHGQVYRKNVMANYKIIKAKMN